MSLIENHLFEKRGAVRCGNSEYYLGRTECCGAFGVEDHEAMLFYFDSNNLSRHILSDSESVCPFCGVKSWDGRRVTDFIEMPQEWRWAAPQDLTDVPQG